MVSLCGTRSGSFHADDVLALIRVFADRDAQVVRSRDQAVLDGCDLVFDVDGVFDLAHGCFDHHQNEYDGPLSSAGMVLDRLRRELVDYVDAVDNGRRTPAGDLPCLAAIVGNLNNDPGDGGGFDDRYLEAVAICGADGGPGAKGAGWDRLLQPLDQGTFDVYALVDAVARRGYTGPIGLQCCNVQVPARELLERSLKVWREFQRRLRTGAPSGG